MKKIKEQQKLQKILNAKYKKNFNKARKGASYKNNKNHIYQDFHETFGFLLEDAPDKKKTVAISDELRDEINKNLEEDLKRLAKEAKPGKKSESINNKKRVVIRKAHDKKKIKKKKQVFFKQEIGIAKNVVKHQRRRKKTKLFKRKKKKFVFREYKNE